MDRTVASSNACKPDSALGCPYIKAPELAGKLQGARWKAADKDRGKDDLHDQQ